MDIHKLKNEAREFKQRFVDDIDSRSTNESWEDFKSSVNNMLENNVPSKTIKDKWDAPWMTSSIKKLIRKKLRAYNTSKKYDTPENRTRFKNLRKLVQSELQNSKNEYLMGLLEISNNSNKAFDQVKSAESTNYSVGKRFWSYIKSLKTNGSGVNTLFVNDCEIQDAKGKAEALSNQYCSVFTDEDLTDIPSMSGIAYPTISDINIDVEGVDNLLKNINVKKASGPDGVSSQILRDLSEELSPVIVKIFSQSLNSGELPDDWLTANITAIFKKGKKCDPANYRPVSLTSVTCKLMEHILFRHIMDHLEKYNILSSFQHGFRSNHSCESQLLITVEDLARNLDRGLQTDVLILDFQKAFDTVPHQRLIRKLDFYGIRGTILTWITKWLSARTQQVVVDGEASEPVHVRSGVPQGTVLGPLMFLIYINNIADNMDGATNIRLFADDCLLYRIIRSSDDTDSLQNDLNSLTNHCQLVFEMADVLQHFQMQASPYHHKKEPNNTQLQDGRRPPGDG